MKISHIHIYRFSIPMEPFAIATGTMDFAQNLFIRVYTNEGIIGVGESSAFPMIVGETQETMLKMAQDFAKLWIGKDPLAIDKRLAELNAFTAFNSTCKSAFDMALYDIAAKHAKLPLYQFLGGEIRKALTDITVGIDEPEIMATKAKDFVKNGATIIKIKLGKNLTDDLKRVAKIREVIGDKTRLRLDANQGWTFEEALLGLNELNKYKIDFCEQPMRTWFDDELPELVKRSPIKIMADESCYNHHDARRLINNNACDMINIKLAKSGGINEALKIYHTATMNNIPCMIGGMLESRLAATACLHFAFACKKINHFDLDTSLLGHLVDPIVGGLGYHNYEMTLPQTTGIGADVNEDYLKNCEMFVI
ncbi:mandelate racemase/muconate lactonizing enzyme family protein [Pedobacter arcticus]|uniref:mandelate racemase/muconate lactonizing enzyme family protein n=1 Tax=Pedobacter arcticus TaxID=752140 RepID=UPI00037323D3|nr:dipeptide epimerase [Pedobacter arcticus]